MIGAGSCIVIFVGGCACTNVAQVRVRQPAIHADQVNYGGYDKATIVPR